MCDLIVKQIPNKSNLTPVEVFYLMQIINALPKKWRNSLTSYGNKTGKVFVLNNQIKLRINKHHVRIDKAASKNIYAEIRSSYEASPTAQAKYTDHYSSASLEWQEIYMLPFKVVMDTKPREFQYKILNRYLRWPKPIYWRIGYVF